VLTLRLAKSRPSGGCSLAWRLQALMAWESRGFQTFLVENRAFPP